MQCNSVQKIQMRTGESFEKRHIRHSRQLLIPKDMHLANTKTGLMSKNPGAGSSLKKKKKQKQKRLHMEHQYDRSSESKKAVCNNIIKCTIRGSLGGMQDEQESWRIPVLFQTESCMMHYRHFMF